MEKNENKKGASGKEEVDVKKHLTPEDDEKLREAYVDALGEILENDDALFYFLLLVYGGVLSKSSDFFQKKASLRKQPTLILFLFLFLFKLLW